MSFSSTSTGDEVVNHFAAQVKGKTCRFTVLLPSFHFKIMHARASQASSRVKFRAVCQYLPVAHPPKPRSVSCSHMVFELSVADWLCSLCIQSSLPVPARVVSVARPQSSSPLASPSSSSSLAAPRAKSSLSLMKSRKATPTLRSILSNLTWLTSHLSAPLLRTLLVKWTSWIS